MFLERLVSAACLRRVDRPSPCWPGLPGWRLLRCALGFKALYLATVVGALWLWDDFDVKEFNAVNARWPREGGPVFGSHFATWDGAHYLYLSEVGYADDVPSCAFYPLLPLLIRGTAPVFGGSHLAAGLVWANVFSLAAWVMFHRLVARRWGEAAANRSLVFLVAFPGALFFQFIYTESLFLLLVLALWWGLEERRYRWAWTAGALLPLTRGPGVFAVLPIAWHLAEPLRQWFAAASGIRQGTKRDSAGGVNMELPGSPASGLPVGKPAARQTWKSALWACASGPVWLLAAPLLGWGIYLALMGWWTGNPFEGFEAQRFWGVHAISNLWNVPKFVAGLFAPTEWHEFRGSLLDRCVFVVLLYALPVLWRLDKGLPVWTYWLGVLPAMSGTFTSYTRFASCAFPLFIALGVGLAGRQWRWARYGLLAVFAVLHVVLVWRFVNFRWAG